ncbi:hypothetical protein BGO17_04055 [Candidatus Saccharibacteria bacterium 49-20]|nr:MAG: hypothetical protein BGO17_04055 [Candidatus Saccharibacteria bacterium 49-20]
MARWASRTGFTVVELLIVVVVIAILAAVTIVAYNGISSRSKQSAVQSLVQQVNKKILAYAVQNSDNYPPDLSAININQADQGKLQYTVNNSASPRTYGLTGTIDTHSYYVSNTIATPTSGGYQGHGQGGVSAITNLVSNPSIESNTNTCSASSGGGTVAGARSTATATSGSSAYRATWSVAATSEVAVQCYAPVEAGKTYAGRVDGRPSWAGALMRIQFAWVSSPSAWSASSSTAAPQNTWSTRTFTATAPATATGVYVQVSFINGARPAVGDTLDADSFMFVEGLTVPNYADGNSTNWIWNGTINNSTSTGPPL